MGFVGGKKGGIKSRGEKNPHRSKPEVSEQENTLFKKRGARSDGG